MDKRCKTCALDGILAYRDTCKRCVESGTFEGWTARTCENCKYDSASCSVEPCHSCFEVKGHPNWKWYGAGADPKAKDEQTDDAVRTCENCKYRGTLGDGEPCHTCFRGKVYSMWERMLTDAELAQTAEDMKPDPVNHPSHYTECSLECIDVMLAVFGQKTVTDFCIINAFKYMWRYEYKNGLEDLRKAERYLAMATDFQMADTEQENRIINMKAELEILMRRVNK